MVKAGTRLKCRSDRCFVCRIELHLLILKVVRAATMTVHVKHGQTSVFTEMLERTAPQESVSTASLLYEEFLGKALRFREPGLGETHRLGSTHRIGDEPLRIQSVHCVPVQRLPGAIVVVKRQPKYCEDSAVDLGFVQIWAAAGFMDTLLRWKMKPEVVYGNEAAIQPGVQA